MNATVYLFGELNSGYRQYPNDYSSKIFKTFYANAKSTTQVAIHRDGDLMFYGYIRKLENEHYIGLCVVMNGVYLKRIESLFSLYESIISSMVIKGRLIHFDEHGEIVTKADEFYTNKEDIDLLTESLRAGFEQFASELNPLPAVSYGTEKDSVKDFTIDDDNDDIVRSSHKNGYTFVYKSKGFNTAQLYGYKGVLRKVSKENDNLKKENTDLQRQIKRIKRQQKQIRNVTILSIAVIGCGIGIYFLNDNLSKANETIVNKNVEIISKNIAINTKNSKIKELEKTDSRNKADIEKKNATIAELNTTIASLRTDIEQIQAVYDEEKERRLNTEKQISEICQLTPMFITGCYASLDYFSFRYYAPKNKRITVTLKATNEKTAVVEFQKDFVINIREGHDTKKLDFSPKLDLFKNYYITLTYNDNIIAIKRKL